MVREFEDAPGEHLIVVVDPWLPPEEERLAAHGAWGDEEASRLVSSAAPSATRNARLEDAISFAATVCWEWCRQPGNRFVLGVACEQPVIHDGAAGRAHALKALECLAVQLGDCGTTGMDVVGRLAAIPLPPAPVLLISAHADRLSNALARQLNRPVVGIDAAFLDNLDFYERPDSKAAGAEGRRRSVVGG
jgi:hypothetical protein